MPADSKPPPPEKIVAPAYTPKRSAAERFLAPAVALMGVLTYPRKFLLISVLFILPLALVMYLLTSEMRKGIDFAEKEELGTRYLRPVRSLSQHVTESRSLARSVAGGDFAKRSELVRKQAEIDDDLRTLAALETETGSALKTADKFGVVAENWRFLKAKLLELTPADCELLHTQLLDDVYALHRHAGDTSNLILDPDLDSYYAMDAVLLNLPQGQQLIGQLGLLAEKTLGRKAPLSPEEKSEFIRLESLLRSNLDATRSGLEVGFRNNPGGQMRPRLEKALQDYVAAGEALLQMLARGVIQPAAPQVSSEDVTRAAQPVAANNAALWNLTATELDGLLHARIAGFAQQRYVVTFFATVALALVLYLLVAFYVGVMRTVNRLREASERMLGGSIDHRVTLETRDELGQVATSFNNIAARLRAEWAQARDESERATAAEAELREQTKLVKLLQVVADAANEAPTAEAALRVGLDHVCAHAGWPVGCAFVPSGSSGELSAADVWHLGDPERFDPFRRVTEAARYAANVGLAGRVFATKGVIGIPVETEEPNLPRRRAAGELGLKGAHGFPVLAGSEVVAVLEFWAPNRGELDRSLADAMAHIGVQLGRVFERQRAEADLRRAMETAEQATRAKSTFLATMSHEIRTPLNAVLGMASLLQDTELTPQQQEFAQVIRNGGDALLGVINDILDFSKIEAGRLELEKEPFDVRGCVESAMDVIAVRGAEKGLELAYSMAREVPAWVVGDVTRVRQVLINLLGNAVKFTERGEVVLAVEAAASEHAGSRSDLFTVHFSVRDTGIGIPADRVAQLFQSFSQVDTSTTRKYGGTGLGLAICKRLVEMMGGRMWVDSEAGRGSTFHFTVEAARATTPLDATNRVADLPDPSSKRLLVVDDNDVNRRIITRVMQGWGFPTRDTGSPLEALRWLAAGERFALGIIDIAMPEMDGVALASAIRQKYTSEQMPLVAFTSLTRQEMLGDRGEFEAFVTKPLKPSYLLDVLINILAVRKIDRPLRQGSKALKQEFDATLGQRLPLRILVAEDVPVNQHMMRVMLGRMAYSADFADNGHEVLRALERRQYDLIFMDMQMPEMDGVQCTHEIVARCAPGGAREHHRPVIVALTANATAEDAALCKAAGMEDFLTKPVKPLELRRCLERWGQARTPDGGKPTAEAKPEPVAAPAVPPTAVAPLIDEVVLADLRDLEADEPGLLASFVDGLMREVPEHVALMRQAIAAGDGEQLRKLAHRLKGTAANVGANGVADACLSLERIGRSGVLTEGGPLVRELEVRCHRTRAFFAEMGVVAP